MNKRWFVALLAALAITFGVTLPANAEPFDDPGQGPGPGAGMQKHERLRERVELMAMWKLTDALNLDQETAAKLFPMLHDLNVQQQKLREKRREIVKGMKVELEKKKPDSKALKKMIEQFQENEIDMVKLRNKKLDDTAKLLTDEQVAKMIVFVPQFERDVRQMIDEVRTRRHDRFGSDRRQGEMELPPPPPEEDLPPLQ
jgi:Spy/CpxP family protein refolding chaperone